nr:hypothetical protein [Tanacetum cinerariifolium]
MFVTTKRPCIRRQRSSNVAEIGCFSSAHSGDRLDRPAHTANEICQAYADTDLEHSPSKGGWRVTWSDSSCCNNIGVTEMTTDDPFVQFRRRSFPIELFNLYQPNPAFCEVLHLLLYFLQDMCAVNYDGEGAGTSGMSS